MALNVGCSAPPGKAADNKTGSWRVFKPVFDLEKCKKCGICILICPESSIHENDEYPEVDYDYCKGCGLCANECPADAIVMILEEK